VIQYYRRTGKLVSIDGQGDSDVVFGLVVAAVDRMIVGPGR